MGFGTKYTREIVAGGGSMADNEKYLKFVKKTVLDGISSGAEDLGSFIVDGLANRGPQGTPLWFSNYAKNKYSKEVEVFTGGIKQVNIKGNLSVTELTERLVGHRITGVNSFEVNKRTLDDVASQYVSTNHKWNADNGLWTFFVSDPDEGASPVPAGKEQLTIVLYKDTTENRDTAEELDLLVDIPDDTPYVTIYYSYRYPNKPTNSLLETNSDLSTKPPIRDSSYFLGRDNTYPTEYMNTVTVDNYSKDTEGVITYEGSTITEVPVMLNVGKETYIKIIEDTDFTSHFMEQVIEFTVSSETTESNGTVPSGAGSYSNTRTTSHFIKYNETLSEVLTPLKDLQGMLSRVASSVSEIEAGNIDEEITPIPLIPLRRISGGVTEKFGTQGLKKRKKRSRWVYEWIEEDKDSFAGDNYNYKTLNHVSRRLFGMGISSFVEEVKEGMDHQDKLQYMHVMYAAPLNTENQGCMRYLIEFFKRYSNNPATLLDNYKQDLVNWNNKPDSEITENPPLPPELNKLNIELKSNTRVVGEYNGKSAQGGYHRTYMYQAAYGTGSGRFKDLKNTECVIVRELPDSLKAKVRVPIYETRTESNEGGSYTYQEKVGEQVIEKAMMEDPYTIYHQINKNKYEYVIIVDGLCKSIEAWGIPAQESLKDMLGWKCETDTDDEGNYLGQTCGYLDSAAAEGDTIMTVPIFADALRRLPARAKGDCAYGAAMVTYGMAYRGKQPSTFKKLTGFLMIIIAAVIGFIAGGPAGAFVAASLAAMGMVGLIDKFTLFIAKILMALGMSESAAFKIAKGITVIIIIVLSGGIDTSTLASTMISTASAGISLTSAVMQANFAEQARKLNRESEALASEIAEVQATLDDATKELETEALTDYDLTKFFESNNRLSLGTGKLSRYSNLEETLEELQLNANESMEFDRILNREFILIEKALFQSTATNMVDIHYGK